MCKLCASSTAWKVSRMKEFPSSHADRFLPSNQGKPHGQALLLSGLGPGERAQRAQLKVLQGGVITSISYSPFFIWLTNWLQTPSSRTSFVPCPPGCNKSTSLILRENPSDCENCVSQSPTSHFREAPAKMYKTLTDLNSVVHDEFVHVELTATEGSTGVGTAL